MNNKLTILITGETGTGKELIARTIHKLTYNDDLNFIPFNMGTVNFEKLEKSIFFNSKLKNKIPAKTFYLKSIDDMSLENQKYFLKILQKFSTKDVYSKNSRIIISSKRKLPDLMLDGDFREDLFYRINVIFPKFEKFIIAKFFIINSF